jgi:aspartyl-tRNA(Asn)/glutamyl-tRNA(Gln) amidotransferase subunit A
MSNLQEALIGYADWIGYGHVERVDAWLKRLEINRPELAYFRAQPLPSCPAYDPAPVAIEAADGIVPNRNSANEASSSNAATALERAKEYSGLHMFTWLAEAPLVHGNGFLAGMPVVIKDLMAIQGVPLSGGSKILELGAQQSDADVIARLRRAGAAIIGTANLHELAYGITSDNPHFGRVVNPAASDRIPGGSSGGSAAAIAAGIVSAAVGTDTAGSIRIPAACCGTVGFKPTYDALPRAGVLDLAPSLDHVGPMGRTVADCAALFAAMLDLPAIPAWRYADLSGRRVAKLTGYFEQPLDDAIRRALQEALDALSQDGAACGTADIQGAEAAPGIQLNTICAEATAVHAQRLQQRGDMLGEEVRVRLEIGHFLPGHWYIKAQRMRQQLADKFDAAFRQADFLICPTMRTPAPPVGAAEVTIDGQAYPLHTAATNLTLPFNLTGLPAISIPWDRTADGVPIGLQLVGRRGCDWQVLALAERLEQRSPWHIRQLADTKKGSHAGP